jgi:hypothetical protein
MDVAKKPETSSFDHIFVGENPGEFCANAWHLSANSDSEK